MTNLPISSPTPAPRETIFSYLARLATVWQIDAPNLAYDMGASFRRLLDQEEEAIEMLAGWAKLDSDIMEELLSWTGIRAGNVRMKFRNELFGSRALRNPTMRGCPVCLREDAAKAKGPTTSAMVMRGDWQFREVTLCVRHHHPLTLLWKTTAPQKRFDIGAQLRKIEAGILAGDFDLPTRAPSAYDFWLDRRLEDGTDETWFKDHQIFIVTTICRLLGQAIIMNRPSKTDQTSQSFHAVGFDTAVKGTGAIRTAIDGIANRATGEPGKTFGAIYTELAQDHLNDPGFILFRDILRECVLSHWPWDAGDVVLRQIVPERRLHSLTTAAVETRIAPKVLEKFLIEAGALKSNDSRPHRRRLFDAKAHAELLSELPTLVGSLPLRKEIGATKQELAALTEEGLLTPMTRIKKVVNKWRVSDGVSLVKELTTGAIAVPEDGTGWETLLLACRRKGVDLAELVRRIRDKRLTVGQRTGVKGFHGIILLKSEVDLIAVLRPAKKEMRLVESQETMAAAQFGRSVGLRDNGAFLALIEAGHVPARLAVNSRTGRSQYRMTPENMAAFHQRFFTLTTLAAERAQHRNTLKATLAAKRISPFSPNGQDFGSIYLRQDLVG